MSTAMFSTSLWSRFHTIHVSNDNKVVCLVSNVLTWQKKNLSFINYVPEFVVQTGASLGSFCGMRGRFWWNNKVSVIHIHVSILLLQDDCFRFCVFEFISAVDQNDKWLRSAPCIRNLITMSITHSELMIVLSRVDNSSLNNGLV